MMDSSPTLNSTGALPPPARTWHRGRIDFSQVRDYGIVFVFVALFLVLSFTSPGFLTTTNIFNLLHQNAAVGIISCAATLVIVAAGFDLSVGAVYVVGGVVSAWAAIHISVPVGLVGGVLVGGVLGLFNGLITTQLRISSFLATLATSLAFSGAAVAITQGFPITVSDSSYAQLGNGGIGEVTWPVIIFAAVAIVLQLLLSRSVFGRYVYAVGGNTEAARNSGVRVDTVRIVTFVVSGLAAALGGVIDASTVSSSSTEGGGELALTAIAAVALGGSSILGGAGAVWRTVLGVLLLAMIANGFDLLGVASYYQDMVKGAIIVVAVAVNSAATRA
jgi:ribose transport system permease protein